MAGSKTSEAKIKFVADTTAFNEGIKNANSKIKEFKSSVKLLETEMKNSGDSTELLKKKHDLLQEELLQTQQKEELLNQKLQKAIEIYGENSKEAQRLRTDIINVKNAEAVIRGEIENCNKKIRENAESMKESQSASRQLTRTIESQETELNKLKKEYTDTILEQGKESDKAKELSGKIGELSTALEKNKTKLSDAQKETEKLTDSFKTAQTASGKLKNEISEQENKLRDLKTKYTDAVLEQGKNSKEARNLAKEMKTLNKDLEDNKKELAEATEKADFFAGSLKDAGESAESAANGGFTVFKGILADLAANAISDCIQGIKELAGSTIQTGMEFTTSMSNVKALSGATAEEMEDLKKTAEEMGAKTSFTASQAADALGYMALAGWDAQSMMDGIGGVLDLAAASQMDLATASDIVTDAMTAFGMSADETGRFVDVLAATSTNSNTTVEMLGESFKYVGSICGSLGYSIEDAGVALGMMANSGIKATQAGTTLRSILTRLSTNAGASKNKLGALDVMTKVMGVSFFDTSGKARDLSDVLKDAREAWGGLTEKEQINYANTIAGKNAMSGFLALMSDGPITTETLKMALDDMDFSLEKMGTSIEGLQAEYKNCNDDAAMSAALMQEYGMSQEQADEMTRLLAESLAEQTTSWDDLSNAVNNSKDAASDMSAEMLNNLQGDVTLMQSAFDGLKISIFDDVESPLRDVVQGITNDVIPAAYDLIDGIKEGITWGREHKDMLAGIGLVVGSLAIGYGAYSVATGIKDAMEKKNVTTLWGLAAAQASTNLAFLACPITWIAAGIALLVGGFIYLWNTSEDFRQFWIDLWDGIKNKFAEVKENFSAGCEEVGEFFSGLHEKIVGTAEEKIKELKDKTSRGLSEIKGIYEEHGGGVKGTVSVMYAGINELTDGKLDELTGKVTGKLLNIKGAYEEHGGGVEGVLAASYEAANELTGGKLELMRSITAGKLDSLRDAWDEKIGKIHDKLSDGLEKMKKLFKFEWKLPEIKLPHFSISGGFSLRPPSVPRIAVDWFAEGGIMTRPTIFGINGDHAMGGGEAGAEAILPIALMEDYIANAMSQFVAAIPQIDYDRLGDAVALSLRKNPGTTVVNIGRRELMRIIEGE